MTDDGAKSILKAGIKAYIRARERLRELGHELAESWDDLVAEAQHERSLAKQAASAAPAKPGAARRPAATRSSAAAKPARETAARKPAKSGRAKTTRSSRRRSGANSGPGDKLPLKPEDQADSSATGSADPSRRAPDRRQ